MEEFRKLGIGEEILKSLHEQKFEKPTEIQEKAIPLVLKGMDIIAGAATGSGKTLVFGSVIIDSLKRDCGIQALILTPTRELAEQVAKSLRLFSKHKPLKIISVYGGVSINPQINDLEEADVVVGTPGRILDHLQRRTIDLKNISILVLDEADRMLDMGFIDDVEKIISQCNVYRQTLLFSATISGDVLNLSKKYMKEPTEIMAETEVDPSKLKQYFYDVEDNEKFSLLVHLLKNDKSGLVMVFCNTQRNTDFIAKNLKLNDINALAIHGGYSQNKRSNVMEKFHAKDFEVLVCTDVAARGLDIKGVSHVYNYDTPNESNNYIHRIGRTARAGDKGKAVTIIASRDYENFARVKRENPNIEKIEKPEFKRAEIGFKHKPRFDRGDNFKGRGTFRRHGERRFQGRTSMRETEENKYSENSGRYRRERGSSRSSGFRTGSRFGARNSRFERRSLRNRRYSRF